MILGSALISLAVLAFGWSIQYRLHLIALIVFSSLVGYGFVSIAISAWSYLVDTFGVYSASATAATVLGGMQARPVCLLQDLHWLGR